MPIRYLPLTDQQKKFIDDNHKRLSLRDLAKELITCQRLVEEYMKENDLPIINHSWAKPPDKIKRGCFDYNNRRDAFVG